ncbi:MAG: aminotransferase class V-fold PLP-dependent enzyme [Polyangiaceae bacterium]
MSGAHEVEPPELFKPAPELTPVIGDRGLFPGLEPLVYANHAGISPPSILARKAIQSWLLDYGKRGAGAYPTWLAQRNRLRGKLAALVGAEPHEIALSQSTTRGILDLALSFDWARGDRVVLFRGEFPANVTPWQRAAELFELEIVMLDADQYRTDEAGAFEALDAELARGARMIAVSQVEFQTGFHMPIAAIAARAKAAGAHLCVDAVQGAGMVEVDVRVGVDFLACGAHKWLMGMEGAGFVYASSRGLANLRPRVAGWLSHVDAVDFLFEGAGKLRYDKPIRGSIDFLEVGNVSATAFAALEASLDAIVALGRSKIFDHVQAFNDAVEAPLVELGFESLRAAEPARRSGSLCLRLPKGVDFAAFVAAFKPLGVAFGSPDGCIRFSPHWPNALDEAEQVVLSMQHALSSARGSPRAV